MTDRVKPRYCETIGKLMNEHKESQEALAHAIGTNRDKVNNWLGNRSKLDIENLLKIAEHYSVSADYLLGLSKDKSRTPSAVDELHLSEAAVARIKEQATNDELSALFSRLAASIVFWGILNDVLKARQYAAAPDETIAEMARTEAETDFRKKAGVSGALLYGERYRDFLRLQIADVIMEEVF